MNADDRSSHNPFLRMDDLHSPTECSKCGGKIKYSGIGEYVCENCGNVERDDYGKVRQYIETHNDNRLVEVAEKTGVSRQAVQRMLDEGRIEAISKRYVDAD